MPARLRTASLSAYLTDLNTVLEMLTAKLSHLPMGCGQKEQGLSSLQQDVI
jgi:hypothetical protein